MSQQSIKNSYQDISDYKFQSTRVLNIKFQRDTKKYSGEIPVKNKNEHK